MIAQKGILCTTESALPRHMLSRPHRRYSAHTAASFVWDPICAASHCLHGASLILLNGCPSCSAEPGASNSVAYACLGSVSGSFRFRHQCPSKGAAIPLHASEAGLLQDRRAAQRRRERLACSRPVSAHNVCVVKKCLIDNIYVVFYWRREKGPSEPYSKCLTVVLSTASS